MDQKDVQNETTMMQHRTAHSSAPHYAKNSAAIKPSVSFMNLSRDKTVINHFVDLADGPSTLQKRDGIPTLKERNGSSPLVYESERKLHLETSAANIKKLKDIQSTLYEQL